MNTDIPEQIKAEQAYRDQNYSLAATLFEYVANIYESQGASLDSAEMKNNSSVAYLKSGNPQKALDIANHTDEIFSEAKDKKRQAIALGNQAAALQELGKLDESLERYQQCDDILSDSGEKDMRGYVLQNISAIQMKQGKQLQALASAQAAISYKKKKSFPERILSWLSRFMHI